MGSLELFIGPCWLRVSDCCDGGGDDGDDDGDDGDDDDGDDDDDDGDDDDDDDDDGDDDDDDGIGIGNAISHRRCNSRRVRLFGSFPITSLKTFTQIAIHAWKSLETPTRAQKYFRWLNSACRLLHVW